MAIQPFSRDLFLDIKQMQEWISDSSRFAHITPAVNREISRFPDEVRIQMFELMSFMHQHLIKGALKVSQIFFESINAKHLLLHTEILLNHLSIIDEHLKYLKKRKYEILCFSINYPRIDLTDYCMQEPLTQENLSDEIQIEQFKKVANGKPIVFYHDRGTCRGICLWFVYLYLKTQDRFDSIEKHILFVAKEFERGASIEASILQNFFNPQIVLGLKCARTMINTQEFESNFEWFKKIHPNIYSLSLGRHRINYIKTSTGDSYIFEPNVGIFKFSQEKLEKAHRLIVKLAKKFNFQESPSIIFSVFKIRNNQ